MKKKLLFLLAGIIFMQFVSAQVPDTTLASSPEELHDYYAAKHRTNNGIGWLLLASGLIMQGAGAASAASQPFVIFGSNPDYNPNKGEGIFIAGVGAALASIPFFIIAHHNKKMSRMALMKASR